MQNKSRAKRETKKREKKRSERQKERESRSKQSEGKTNIFKTVCVCVAEDYTHKVSEY